MHLADSSASRTDWSMIAQAALGEGDEAADALEQLVRRYWPAIYAFVRRTGRDVHEASDLTQGFFCDVIISRRLCEYADPQRGRFRSLLLTAVKNYVREQHRHDRHDKAAHQLSAGSSGYPVVVTGTDGTPEEEFQYRWSATLVHHVLSTVQAECLADGLNTHWTVFEHRVVRPMLFDEPTTDYATLVKRLDLKDEAQAANLMITVKRRFARAMYEAIGQTVRDLQETDDELHELLRDLERTR